MSSDGSWRIEDEPGDDIVRLDQADDANGDDGAARSAWVNAGAFALLVALDMEGNLRVEVYPCGNETEPLAAVECMRPVAMQMGAMDVS